MSPIDEKLPESIDLTHHLSAFSRARPLSPLKGLQKYWGKPGIISLAGGLPSPDVFPFSSVGADILLPNAFPSQTEPSKTPLSWLWNIFSSGKPKTVAIEIPRHASTPGQLDLATVLQYSMASGQPKLLDFARELTGKVFRPGYSDWTCPGTCRPVLTLCNPGEGVLTSTWTYPSALACMLPYNIKAVPVDMDGQGMRADALREVLANWDAKARGMPRPHVMYTTMALGRKKEIYDVCVEFARNERKGELDLQAYIDHLAPSYLRYAADTFSKTIAPGCRMGWFTQAETSTQAPCGFSQALIISLVEQWGFDGFLRWTQGLQTQYTVRRDFIIDCLADEFDLRVGVVANSGVDCFTGCDVYTAYPKVNPRKELEWDLWVELAEAGVLFGPGQMFAATATGHFRVSFSNAEFNTMKKAISIFARVIVKFFRA
ncbi:pyridoxal phosphate-dependent transferase [Ephemerocybe angulata]|uniref:Pyridoxal phosphate-dependent transferase n=1 Tax=Ephemerocybe angulata TaxID=980116 RepID=A0A8H6MB44_9AGAR|nr:pyridoxal phosphate-dependent transferase [Tulosesus angulatus]